MAQKFQFKGMDVVLRNLNNEVRAIQGRSRAGLLEAGLIVKGRSLELTPVRTGKLRNSAYGPLAFGTPENPGVEIGYQASYAPFVHEIVRTMNPITGQRTGRLVHHPVGQAKFLETALVEKREDILEAIRRNAKVGGK